MTSFATVPVYPPPNRPTRITVTITDPTANYVRIYATGAPPGSELREKLDNAQDPRNRVLVYKGRGGSDDPWNATFDVGGKYTFAAEEWARSGGFGGGFQGDPDGAQTETLVANGAVSIYVGERLLSTIRAGSDSVDLVLWVWDSTIRATTRGVHGEESPRLTKESPTGRELSVLESASISAAVAALANTSVSSALGTASSVLANIVGKFNAHRIQSGVHQSNDGDNDIPTGLASAANAKVFKQSINEILPRIRNHYLNDAAYGGEDAGRDSGGYHDVSGLVNDNLNLPIIDGASNEEDAYWALADLWRSYEAHRASTAFHDVADSTNTLTALPPLLAIAKEIFAVWASTNPTAPSTVSNGATRLLATGFRSEPLS